MAAVSCGRGSCRSAAAVASPTACHTACLAELLECPLRDGRSAHRLVALLLPRR